MSTARYRGCVERRQASNEASSSSDSPSESEHEQPPVTTPHQPHEEPVSEAKSLPERVRAAAFKRNLLRTVRGKTRKSCYYRLAVEHGWDRGCRASKLYELEDYLTELKLELPTNYVAPSVAQRKHLNKARTKAVETWAKKRERALRRRTQKQAIEHMVLMNSRGLSLNTAELSGLFSGLAEAYGARARSYDEGGVKKKPTRHHMRKPVAPPPSSESESSVSEEESKNPPEEQKIGPPLVLRRERISDYTTRAPSVASDDMGLCDFENMAFSDITEI